VSIPPQHLDRDELSQLADALDAVSRKEIEDELSKLPSDWPASDGELGAVAPALAEDAVSPLRLDCERWCLGIV
jgi:hypothetical protein